MRASRQRPETVLPLGQTRGRSTQRRKRNPGNLQVRTWNAYCPISGPEMCAIAASISSKQPRKGKGRRGSSTTRGGRGGSSTRGAKKKKK